MSGELITEEVCVDNTQVNVRINKATYNRFMSYKDKMYLKGFNLSMTVAINDGLEKAIECAELWLKDHSHLHDKKVARRKHTKVKPTTTEVQDKKEL